ncbi:MAG: hypothetical protein IJM90_03835 [Firmicutes bacterium]|nr:hypothetical protein [Bacillota bacterium]
MAPEMEYTVDLFEEEQTYTSGNLAYQLAPAFPDTEIWEPEFTPEEQPETVQKPYVLPQPERRPAPAFPLYKRVLLIGGVLICGLLMLSIAADYSRLFEARQVLAEQQEILNLERKHSEILKDTAVTGLSLTDLRLYAIEKLSMRDAVSGEIVELGPLNAAYTVQEETQAEHQETQVKFHFFGK